MDEVPGGLAQGVLLDWSGSKDSDGLAKVAGHPRTAGRCVDCGEPTVLWNPDGDPQHKVCAEANRTSEDAAASRYYEGQRPL